MNDDQETNEAQAVGKPVVGDQPAASAPMAPTPGSAVDVTDTVITTAGVFRCCLATVACEHLDAGRRVTEGEKSACVHCKRTFTLRKPIRGKMVWYPDDFEFKPENC